MPAEKEQQSKRSLCSVGVDVDISLREGELRLVLVYPDGSCVALWHAEGLTANGEHQVFIEEAGRYRLKIAGVHAKGSIKLQNEVQNAG